MKHRLFFFITLFSLAAHGQRWSAFLDPSRAIDWSNAGFTIPSYSSNCTTQPTLTANSPSAASANATAIHNALASCDSSHNVVNIPAGTYYVAGFNFGTQGKQVLRGAGPNSSRLYMTSNNGCGGFGGAICMMDSIHDYAGSSDVLSGGSRQCQWTAGYAQGTTTITLSSCGSAPPVNQTLVLDQANETSDTGGIYNCDDLTAGCTNYAGPGNNSGRVINGVTHSQQQTVYVTGVTSNGNGSYSVTITPGIYYNNVRSSQSPGAYWPGFVQNDGIENVTLDYSQNGAGSTDIAALTIYDCYQCWVKNVRSMYADRNHVFMVFSANDVIRDSYFYQSAAHYSESYGIEPWYSSAALIENNIFQQLTDPLMFASGTGSVVSYNYGAGNLYTGSTGYLLMTDQSHNAGNQMNLWEGNVLSGISSDIGWGSSPLNTYFRNMLPGWQSGMLYLTMPIRLNAKQRAYNVVGNVLGQPGYHDTYQSYATSSTAGSNGSKANSSIYELGWSDDGGQGVCNTPPVCDPLVSSTLMRWGNYDTVNATVQWSSADASPGAVPYVNSNFSATYFNSLSHSLPASLHYGSAPSWWPSGKAWPPIGPDVSSGNLGTCTGTYAGAQATSSNQCSGGSLNLAWSSHATSIPAQDCFLNVMGGPPDASGSVLSFDASKCYSASGGTGGTAPGSPAGLVATVD